VLVDPVPGFSVSQSIVPVTWFDTSATQSLTPVHCRPNASSDDEYD